MMSPRTLFRAWLVGIYFLAKSCEEDRRQLDVITSAVCRRKWPAHHQTDRSRPIARGLPALVGFGFLACALPLRAYGAVEILAHTRGSNDVQ
jgi:hypothetical protein